MKVNFKIYSENSVKLSQYNPTHIKSTLTTATKNVILKLNFNERREKKLTDNGPFQHHRVINMEWRSLNEKRE